MTSALCESTTPPCVPSLQFVFYLLWTNCMIAFAFLLSTLFRSSKTGGWVGGRWVGGVSYSGAQCLDARLPAQSCQPKLPVACWHQHNPPLPASQYLLLPRCLCQRLPAFPPHRPPPAYALAAVTVGFLYVLGSGLVGYLLLQQFVSQQYWW